MSCMQLETKFLRLRQPVALGDCIDGWRVCWLGGWDKGRVFYIAMVVKADVDAPTGVRPTERESRGRQTSGRKAR